MRISNPVEELSRQNYSLFVPLLGFMFSDKIQLIGIRFPSVAGECSKSLLRSGVSMVQV